MRIIKRLSVSVEQVRTDRFDIYNFTTREFIGTIRSEFLEVGTTYKTPNQLGNGLFIKLNSGAIFSRGEVPNAICFQGNALLLK